MPVQIRELGLPGVLEIVPERLKDARGFFCETFSEAVLARAGLPTRWVQDNHSYSARAGTIRGLHFQTPPFAQAKLVGVLRGAVYDAAVDIRRGSPQYGKWTGIELNAKSGNQIYVPEGFAHGYLTLEPDTEVIYKVTAPYSREHDRAIRFDDPGIGISWPHAGDGVHASDKDRAAPMLSQTDSGFAYRK